MGDLKNPGTECLSPGRFLCQGIHHGQQVIDAFFPKGRTEAYRKELSCPDQPRHIGDRNLLTLKKTLHHVLVADCDLLLQVCRKGRFSLKA